MSVIDDFKQIADVNAVGIEHGGSEGYIAQFRRRLVGKRQRSFEALAARHGRLREFHLHMGTNILRLASRVGEHSRIAHQTAVWSR